jgi:ATP-dependent RNA helicase DDX21
MSAPLRAHLRKLGIGGLFPVQRETFDRVVARGEDVVVRSRTGSGKTLGFVLPVVELLARQGRAKDRRPRAIVLTPTRELCTQVAAEFARVGRGLGLHVAPIYGGAAIGPQAEALSRGVDVVVGTPGRVQDMIERDQLSLSGIQFAILDEADEMLKMGFQDNVEFIYR